MKNYWTYASLILTPWVLLVLVGLCQPAKAQSWRNTPQRMRLANESTVPFHGWVNSTTDEEIPEQGTWSNGDLFIRGERSGKDTWSVDVYTQLSAGEHRHHNWEDATEGANPPGWAVTTGLVEWFGGAQLRVGGQPIPPYKIEVDGAAILVSYMGRVGPLVVDIWFRWYPSQPAWIQVESYVTFSDQSTPDMEYTSPELRLEFGRGDMVYPLGNIKNNVLLKDGTRFGDGQAMANAFYLVFADRVRNASEWATFGALSEQHVAGVGIRRLWADGNPRYNGDAHAWAQHNRLAAFGALDSWAPPFIGAAPNSGVTGAQEDQVFVRMEPMMDPSAAPLVVAAAMKMANRPNNHRNRNGSIVNFENQSDSRLIFWSGRPHWHTGVSPNQLGKVGKIVGGFSGGWFGPDREHTLYNTVGAAARYSNSRAVEQVLRHVAECYLLQDTVQPGWSTSGPDASRSIGWAGILVVWLDRELEDRELASRVTARWRNRVRLVYVPQLTKDLAEAGGWWDKRLDNRLGLPAGVLGVMPWQSSIGAWGMDYACRHVGPRQGLPVALQQAKQCVDLDWIEVDGKLINLGNQPFDATERADWLASPEWRQGVSWFATTWGIPAVDLVLRYEPSNAKALRIRDLYAGNSSWTPPK